MSADITQYIAPSFIAGLFGVVGVVIGGHLQRRKNDADITAQITDTALKLLAPLREQNTKLLAQVASLEDKYRECAENYEAKIEALQDRVEILEEENERLKNGKRGMVK